MGLRFFVLEIVLLLVLGVILVNLIRIICEILRPDYLKTGSFFEMENDSDLLEITVESGIQVTVHYADYIYDNVKQGGYYEFF